jgi:hypothetical protein
MQKALFILVLVSSVVLGSEMPVHADDCPSGQYYRMSGRCADANGMKATGQKPGYIQFPNAQRHTVTIKRATNYAGCVRNGHSLGYGQAQIESYCHEHYAQ